MGAEIHKSDTTLIERTIKDQDGTAVDISTATTKQFIFKAPDGTITTITASFTNTGTDGKIRTTLSTSHWNVGDIWKLQCYIVLSGGTSLKSNIEDLHVHENLN